MDFIESLRPYMDPKLILENHLSWGLLLTIIGFSMGILVAFAFWFRSARRIKDLELEHARLTKGDILVDEHVDDTDAEERVGEAVTVEQESEVAITPSSDERPQLPIDADDLTLLEGIDEQKAAKLHRAGIYKFAQLEGLDEDRRREMSSKLGWPDINWGAWGATAAAAGLGGATLLNRPGRVFQPLVETKSTDSQIGVIDESELSDDFRPKTTFTVAPEDADDLTLLDGIDDEKAAALNQAGIYKFSQLEELDEAQRRAFTRKFNFPDFDFDRVGAVAAAGVAGASILHVRNEPEVSTLVEEPSEPASRPIVAPAVDSANHEVAAAEEAEPVWNWESVFSQRAEQRDSLVKATGVSLEDASRLNSDGVFTVEQFEALPESRRNQARTGFAWEDIDWGKWGVAAGAVAAVAGATAMAAETGENHPDQHFDPAEAEDLSAVEDPANADNSELPVVQEPSVESDDFTLMDGVTAEHAAELNRLGIYTFDQLSGLPEEQQAALRSKFGWQNIDWSKWGTLGAAGAAVATGAAIVAASENDDSTDLEESAEDAVEQTEAVTGEAESEAADDAEDVAVIWKTESEKLVAARMLSIDNTEKYGELSLASEDFSEVIDEEFNGEEIEVHPRYGIIYTDEPDPIDDLTNVRGIGLATEKQLNDIGIYRFKQIANWNAGAIEGISMDLGLGTRVRDDDWVYQAGGFAIDLTASENADESNYEQLISDQFSGENVSHKKGLGILYNEVPDEVDDLSEIKGIGQSLENRLNEYGVYRFLQIANWNEHNIAAFNDRLSFVGRIERDDWVEQARRLASRAEVEAGYVLEAEDIPQPDLANYEKALARFAGEPVEVDLSLGVIYRERPPNTDDLKQIWGIGSRIESELNELGIFRLEQIAEWNDYNVREIDQRLGLKGRIKRDQWIFHSQNLVEERDALQAKYGGLLSSQFAGEPVTVKPRYGIIYTQIPEIADDLTEISGIGPRTEQQLNDVGICMFKQIASWDREAVEVVEEYIDGPGRITRDQWIEQAKALLASDANPVVEDEPSKPENEVYLQTLNDFDGENVDIDERFGVVYTGRPTIQDDLKRIRGVGKYIEQELNNRGVYRFKQISNWNRYNIWAFGKDLLCPGRITREDWVSQSVDLAMLEDYRNEAEALVKKEYPGKPVRVDRELGIVYSKKPEAYDDLGQLEGIDDDTEARLNSDGIYTFKQIERLQGPQRDVFASRFALDDIDWSKWSSVFTIGTGAVSAASIESEAEDESGADAVQTAPEPASENVVESEQESDRATGFDQLPVDEPKGIFGIGSNGGENGARRVAFIMDVSRSLTPAQLSMSKTELSAAVSSLPEGSLYQVIFFSGPTWFAHQRMVEGGARGEDVVIADGDQQLNWNSGFGGFEFDGGNDNLPGSEWREATPENIAATLNDIEEVDKSYGTTWHLPLTMAMNLEPPPQDVYFLTDGETARQDQVAEDMVGMAKVRGNARLHTIALMVPGASVPLHRMATGTGGEYSLVIAGGEVLKDDELREYLAEKDITLND